MAQDDFAAALQRRKQQAPPATSDAFSEALRRRRAGQAQPDTSTVSVEGIRQPLGPVGAIGTMLATSVPGAPAISAASMAAFGERQPGESFGAAYQRKMRELGQQEQQAKEELYPGVGTALQLAPMMAAASRLPLVGAKVAKDASALAKLLAASKRVAGAGIVGGVESAGRQGMDDKALSPVESAAMSAAVTAGLESLGPAGKVAGRMVARLPLVGAGLVQTARALSDPVQELAMQARRGTTEGIREYLVPRFGSAAERIAAAIEPTDITRIQRTAAQALPTQGQTVAQMRQQAEKAAGSAAAIESEAKTAAARAKELGQRVKQRVGTIKTIGTEQAKRDAQAVVDAAEKEAGGLIAGVRTGIRDVDAVRDWTRQLQLAEGQQSYQAVRAIGAPPEPDPEVYREILADKTLKRVLIKSYNALRREAQNVEPGMPIREDLRRVTVGGRNVPEVSLEMFDNIRRHIFDQPVMSKVNATGISASERRRLLQQVDRLEERFLSGYGTSDAAEAIRAARQQYRARFEQLEALRDGLSLGTAKAGKTPGLIKPNRMDLDEITRRVQGYSTEAQEAFKVGAAKWFDNAASQIDRTSGELGKLVKFTKSEEGIRRLRLAFDDATVDKMVQIAGAEGRKTAAQTATEQRAAQLIARARQQGQQRVSAVTSEAERLAQDLTQQQARAGQLASLAETAQEGIQSLTDFTAGRGFAATLPGRGLGVTGQREVGGAMAGAIQDQIRGLTPSEAIAKLEAYRQNPAARAMFGDALDRALAQLRPRPSAIPSVRAALTGQAAGRF